METATEDNQKESADNAVPNATASNATVAVPAEPKKSKKDERSKKDDKNIEQFMRSLNSIPSLEEKLSLVCKKYVQTADDNKKMQFYIKQSDKRYALLLKEKEQLQLEFNKTILVKSKLENLCRELQKQNKAIKEESLLKIREEEERRKETQAKFQATLTEITNMLQQNNEKNAKLRDDNISMTEKFKSVVTQYQLREQQVDKMSKQMALENQLSEAKMQKANLEHQADKERLLAEIEQLKVTVATYRAKVMELQGTETNLRSQLTVYTDKYDEFQNALVKSNQMFGGFKEQMDKMSKKIKKLEKESLSWKSRWETSQTALLDMCGERQASDERAAAAARQLRHMQSLCRTLQGERSVLLATLKEHNIERPPLPAPAPPSPLPAPAPPASDAKVEAMAANCAQLRNSLAHLQTQLNSISNKQKEESPKPEPAKPEKQEKKKSKSKKNKGEKKAETEAPKEERDEKESTEENQIANGSAQKVDNETIENLIHAINNANINLCDIELVSNEVAESPKVDEVNEAKNVETVEGRVIETSETNDVEKNQAKDVEASEAKDAETSQAKDVETRQAKDAETSQTKDVETSQTKDAETSQAKDVKASETKDESSLPVDSQDATSNAVSTENGANTPVSNGKEEIVSNTDIKSESNSKGSSQNLSIVETNNDEISHINEVKTIAETA